MKKDRLRVLLIEDDRDDYLLVKALLSEVRSARFDLEWITDYYVGFEAICGGGHDVCLLDYHLGERSGLDLMRELALRGCEVPVILLTGQGGYDLDVEAMKTGAADYLSKGQINADILERSIRHSMERKHAESELRRYRDQLAELVRERTIQLELANKSLRLEIAERKQMQAERERLIDELQGALANVKMLSGLLPICASCKKIRDDQGYWRQIEAYICDHSEADFSHGICPECAKELYPKLS